jgi:Ca2+-binding RTX toxin-like protein
LAGGAGNDDIVGGPGRDRLSGGRGADRFRWDTIKDGPAAAPDTVLDFRRPEHDRIDLTSFGPLSFVGDAAFDGPRQLRAVPVGRSTRVEINLRGKTGAEMAITLKGVTAFDPDIDMVR